MPKFEECPKCGTTRFSAHYQEMKPGWRFLWWSAPSAPEQMMLWCLRCDYKWERPDLVGNMTIVEGQVLL